MNFPFVYLMSIAGRPVAELEGVAVLAGDPFSRDSTGACADWTVVELQLHEIGPGPTRMVVVPDEHPLHDRLLADVLSGSRHEMDEAWGRHVAARLARAS